MSVCACPALVEGGPETGVPVTPLAASALGGWLATEPEAVAAWVRQTGFSAAPGEVCLIPGSAGEIGRVLLGVGAEGSMWDWAALAPKLPALTVRIDEALPAAAADAAAIAFALAGYHFDRYRKKAANPPALVWPRTCDRQTVAATVRAVFLARDLINTPASDMGPAELAAAVEAVAGQHGGRCRVIVGEDLLAQNYPAIHAVGRASARAPRLIDLTWGEETAAKVTLVGKGVCFDSGGLDVKPSAAMKLMKKDMAGAAIMLALAGMVMSRALPVRLRLLIPAVENSISGDAMRPLDAVRTRAGLTVEVGNTDAEGRLILADALAAAASEPAALIIDAATLTGAARVALGTELPALFTHDDGLAEALLAGGRRVEDPLWRLPLWPGYRRHIEGKVADLTNAPDHAFAGAITAALFLAEFVAPARSWAHLDVMAWNSESRPGRPEGGEATGLRALFALLSERFG
jgi:leucyl aminopeptidase